MGNACNSKQKFSKLKNSVVLTKQKTDKKNKEEILKQLNENYQEKMQKELTNVVVNSEIMIIPEKTPKKPTVSFENAGNFPDFKRHEYDEGQLRRKLVYFQEIAPNSLEKQGGNLYNLLTFAQKTLKIVISPCESALMRLAMGERAFCLENFKENANSEGFSQYSEENPLKLAVKVLTAGLFKAGVEVLPDFSAISSNFQSFVNESAGKSQENVGKTEEIARISKSQLLRPQNLHLLSTNCAEECLLIEFLDAEPYTFGALSAENALRADFFSAICSELAQFLDKPVIPFSFQRKSVELLENSQKTLRISVYFRDLSGNSLEKLRVSSETALKSRFPSHFLSISRERLVRTLKLKENDWNPYANREFRENMPAASSALLKTLGGFPYYKPGNGWKRFAFEVSDFSTISGQIARNPEKLVTNAEKTQENAEKVAKKSSFFEKSRPNAEKDGNWLNPANNEPDQGQWANGYACFLRDFTENSTFLRESLENCEDCGPNRDAFAQKTCGKGVVFSHKPEYFFENTAISRSFPVEIAESQAEIVKKRWFLVLLQCRVRPSAIRVPKSLENEVFLANSPEDVRPNGLLLREISKEEREKLVFSHK